MSVVPRSPAELTSALARALGVPPTAYKAVLTLESGQLPKLAVSMYCTDSQGRFVIECSEDELTGNMTERIRSIHFMLRLAPFR